MASFNISGWSNGDFITDGIVTSDNDLFNGVNTAFEYDTHYSVTFTNTLGNKQCIPYIQLRDKTSNVANLCFKTVYSNNNKSALVDFYFPSGFDYSNSVLFIQDSHGAVSGTIYNDIPITSDVIRYATNYAQLESPMSIQAGLYVPMCVKFDSVDDSNYIEVIFHGGSGYTATYTKTNFYQCNFDKSIYYRQPAVGSSSVSHITEIEINYQGVKSEETTFPVSIVNNLTNITLTTSLTELTLNTSNVFECSVDDGYTVNTIPHLSIVGDEGTLFDSDGILINGVYRFTVSPTITYTNCVATFTGSATETIEDSTYLYYDTSELTHATFTPSTSNINHNTNITYTITPNNGYYFASNPSVVAYGVKGTSRTEVLNTIINPVENVYSFTINSSDYDSITIYFVGSGELISSLQNLYPFSNFYVLTKDELTSLSEIRFEEFTIGDTETETVDLSSYVMNIFKSYLPIPKTADKTPIYYGYVSTELEGSLLSERFSSVETNSITLVPIYNNTIDLQEKLYCYLPFYGVVSLDIEKYYNKNISIEYTLDNTNGACNINIKGDEIVLDSFSTTLKLDIPYNLNVENNKSITGAITNNNFFNLQASIKIVYKDVFSQDFNTINDTDEFVELSSLEGYCQGDCYKLFVDENYITSNEISSIKQLISEGVII